MSTSVYIYTYIQKIYTKKQINTYIFTNFKIHLFVHAAVACALFVIHQKFVRTAVGCIFRKMSDSALRKAALSRWRGRLSRTSPEFLSWRTTQPLLDNKQWAVGRWQVAVIDNAALCCVLCTFIHLLCCAVPTRAPQSRDGAPGCTRNWQIVTGCPCLLQRL